MVPLPPHVREGRALFGVFIILLWISAGLCIITGKSCGDI